MLAYNLPGRRRTVADQVTAKADVMINNGQGLYKFKRGDSYTIQFLNHCALTPDQIAHWFKAKKFKKLVDTTV